MSFKSYIECFSWYKRNNITGEPIEALTKWSKEHWQLDLRNSIERLLWTLKPKTMNMSKTDDEKYELFKKFYSETKVLVSNMQHDDYAAFIEVLEDTAFEAKARLTAVVDDKREKAAKLSLSQKEWLMPRGEGDGLVSDAIAAVASRKKRMTKIEKINEQLKGYMTDEDRDLVVRSLEKNATDKGISLMTFVKKKSDEVKASVEPNGEPKKKFDPSFLKKKV